VTADANAESEIFLCTRREFRTAVDWAIRLIFGTIFEFLDIIETSTGMAVAV